MVADVIRRDELKHLDRWPVDDLRKLDLHVPVLMRRSRASSKLIGWLAGTERPWCASMRWPCVLVSLDRQEPEKQSGNEVRLTVHANRAVGQCISP
jgi:hypothetical protein